MIIETERLYFRELLETDIRGVFSLDSDPEVHQYLGGNPIESAQQALNAIKFIRQQYIDYGVGRLAIIEKETNSFVGWGGFKLITDLTNGHKNYHDLGYRFLKTAWGKGYATESSKATVEYGFNKLKLPVIYAMADRGNLQSRKVLKKCGFIEKGLFDYDLVPHYWYELFNQSGV
ncbi:GNAT family N-acetyltransferase [Pedobacter hiemivivus]|uniref:N-acetyltransferase n=1 Tax=Pedobacter hiemivivus TaxID=2530454 RepID=A0A4U1GL21_9SPHI|nr:GNAT family N-acetyltransferase [Pedobacter hiemivivus]TCC99482.1 N-acetyltransferase [Pedobacter hiemivivus]TKC63673.1 GNAT family N-acetyltransferase [Pedobacter hiemivivus]